MDSTRHGNLSETKTSDDFEIVDADPDEYIEATSRYQLGGEIAVSYTHLTLPTICSV